MNLQIRFYISVFQICFVVKSSAQTLVKSDSLQIASVLNDWDKAWQIKDYVLASKGYSEDADFTNAFGDKGHGRKEVQALLQEVFSLPFVMAGNSETVTNKYQVLNSKNVIVYSFIIRKGQQMPDGSLIPDRKTSDMRVFRKTNQTWAITGHLISDARDKQNNKH